MVKYKNTIFVLTLSEDGGEMIDKKQTSAKHKTKYMELAPQMEVACSPMQNLDPKTRF